MRLIKYAIVDDDMLAHSALINLMEIHEDFECIGQYYDVMSATSGIKSNAPDFIFLDVEMPHLMGFELIKYIDKSIKVVLTTSHRNFACEGFEYGVFDFLTKPIRPERLFQVVFKLKNYFGDEDETEFDTMMLSEKPHKTSHLVVTKAFPKGIVSILKNEIYYITKTSNHAEIHTYDGNKYYKLLSLKEIMKDLPPKEFVFVNFTCIVNIKNAVTVDGETVVINNEIIPISKNNRSNFKTVKKL